MADNDLNDLYRETSSEENNDDGGLTIIGLNDDDINNIMEQNKLELNASLPAYSHLSEIRIQPKEFEKTPKKSIKRYLYQSK